MPYDTTGEPLERVDPLPTPLVLLLGMILGIGIAYIALTGSPEPEPPKPQPEETVRTQAGDIRVYTFTDESGAQYFVTEQGGITPRLDYDGDPIIINAYE